MKREIFKNKELLEQKKKIKNIHNGVKNKDYWYLSDNDILSDYEDDYTCKFL